MLSVHLSCEPFPSTPRSSIILITRFAAGLFPHTFSNKINVRHAEVLKFHIHTV